MPLDAFYPSRVVSVDLLGQKLPTVVQPFRSTRLWRLSTPTAPSNARNDLPSVEASGVKRPRHRHYQNFFRSGISQGAGAR